MTADKCNYPNCDRKRIASSSGSPVKHGVCWQHLYIPMGFTEPRVPEWVRRANHNALPTRIEGGVKA